MTKPTLPQLNVNKTYSIETVPRGSVFSGSEPKSVFTLITMILSG